MLSKSKNRDYLIDVMKGIAIFLVVIGHSIGNVENPINKIILNFHMAIFFFCTGMLWKYKKISICTFIKEKLSLFFLPQIIIGIFNCVWYGIIVCIILHKNQLTSLPWLSYFLTWFLPSMFYSIVLLTIIGNCFEPNLKLLFTLLLVMLISMIIINYLGMDDILHLCKIPFALFFILAGCIFSKLFPIDKRNIIFKKSKMLFPVFLVLLCICSKLNSPVLWYSNSYGNLLLMIIGAFSGIYLTMQCANIVVENRLVRYWGMNSMTIYVYQFITYRCLSVFWGKLIQINILSVLLTIICSMICLTIWCEIIRKIKN